MMIQHVTGDSEALSSPPQAFFGWWESGLQRAPGYRGVIYNPLRKLVWITRTFSLPDGHGFTVVG